MALGCFRSCYESFRSTKKINNDSIDALTAVRVVLAWSWHRPAAVFPSSASLEYGNRHFGESYSPRRQDGLLGVGTCLLCVPERSAVPIKLFTLQNRTTRLPGGSRRDDIVPACAEGGSCGGTKSPKTSDVESTRPVIMNDPKVSIIAQLVVGNLL